MTIGGLYRNVRAKFRAAELETPDLDARILVSAALDLSTSQMLLREDELAPDAARLQIEHYAAQRLMGMPVGRILGEREFWGLSFALNASTLEPRPDTETLVDAVLSRMKPEAAVVLADIGTGTGAIAIALLSELAQARCVAIDLSESALDCACANAKRHGVDERFFGVCADHATALGVGFDWIISNPPYIRTEVMEQLSCEVRENDPALALDGGEDGLDAYRVIVAQAAAVLAPMGRIALEIGFDQAEEVQILLCSGGFRDVEIIQDLSGNDRVLVAAKG
ncbi:peptide chain release factor N(5)-glutamine methyltransferase [Roseibium algae]|uniref:Release factor glutamine methyltransferase n=1 Tax=Roseibium algae TaxID=3123038 RepID=A0ABU8TP84_9HYPH